ncbi:MAG: hypothetical protein ABW032_09435, partial [Burkholderiaceae bacterium]
MAEQTMFLVRLGRVAARAPAAARAWARRLPPAAAVARGAAVERVGVTRSSHAPLDLEGRHRLRPRP